MDKGDITINLNDLHSDNNSFRQEVLDGLQKRQKEIPA